MADSCHEDHYRACSLAAVALALSITGEKKKGNELLAKALKFAYKAVSGSCLDKRWHRSQVFRHDARGRKSGQSSGHSTGHWVGTFTSAVHIARVVIGEDISGRTEIFRRLMTATQTTKNKCDRSYVLATIAWELKKVGRHEEAAGLIPQILKLAADENQDLVSHGLEISAEPEQAIRPVVCTAAPGYHSRGFYSYERLLRADENSGCSSRSRH